MSVTKEKITAEVEPAPLPNGPAAASILAGGIGAAVYALLITLVEASPAFKTMMTLNKGVGPLSGKTIFGMAAFIVAWVALGFLWKGKNVNLNRVWQIALGLVIFSLLFTFPPIYTMFAAG